MSATARAPRLALEALSDRLVPAVNLTARGAEALVGDAVVRQVDPQPTGTGYIRSFVRVQGAAPGGGAEQGYNTDARPLQYDENKSPQFTRSLTLGKVPVVSVNGVNYREFLLDINQKASASKLSLDEVRLYTGAVGNLAGYNPSTRELAGLAPRFELADSVILDARLNSGSGSGDMTLLVPEARFAGARATDFVYLYSKLGATAGYSANGGFEEWAVKAGGAVAPPPAAGTASLSGRVYVDQTGAGIAGVAIHLTGRDAGGNNVDLVALTDGDGRYEFTALRAGTYTLQEEQPPGYLDGDDAVGSVDGAESGVRDGNDRIAYILLADGSVGSEYNFVERLEEPT